VAHGVELASRSLEGRLMFTLRCTKKLLARLRVRPVLRPPPSTTKLGDWYADTLNLGHERLVLCVSELTLLPVVVPAIGAEIDLNAKLARGLRETLESLGAPTAAIDTEVNQLLEVTVAKTASRVVLGTMNDFQFMVRHIRNQLPTASLLDLGLELADRPCSPIDGSPKDAALAALGGEPRRSKAKLRIAPPPPPRATKPRAITDAEYEEMVETATVDAYGEAEQVTGWHCVIDEHLKLPFETAVLGVAVRVEKIDLLDDDTIVAVCRRGHHRQTVPILDLPLPKPTPEGAEWLEAYRRWRQPARP
jgi:Calcium binding